MAEEKIKIQFGDPDISGKDETSGENQPAPDPASKNWDENRSSQKTLDLDEANQPTAPPVVRNYSENEESSPKEPNENVSGAVNDLPFSKKTDGSKINYDFIQPPQPNLQEASLFSLPPPLPQLKRSKKRKLFIVLGVAVAFLLVVGGSAFGYFFFFPPPEKVIEQSLAKIYSEKNFSYEGIFEFSENSGSQKPDSPTKFSFEGSVDRTNDQDKKGLFSAKIDVKGNSFSPEGFSAELEGRNRGKVFYFRLNTLSGTDSSPLGIEQYTNKWMKFDPESIKEKLRSEIPDSESYMDNFLNNDQSGKLSEEQAAKINDVFGKSGVIKVIKKLPSENIDGTSTFHYQFGIDKEKLKLFLTEMEKIRGDDKEKISPTNYFDEFAAFLEEKAASSQQEIWIGRWDKLPRKIQFKFTEGETSASFSLIFSKFGVPFGVTEPESSVPIEDIIFDSLNQAKGKATIASFRATATSANPAAMSCADESQITGGNSGSPICSSKANLVFDDSWPDAPSSVCSKALKYVAYDTAPADGKYSFSASCQSPIDNETVLMVCSQEGCLSSDKTTPQADLDRDNLPDELENTFGTNSNNPDSDADGYKDGDELLKGYNPLIKGQ